MSDRAHNRLRSRDQPRRRGPRRFALLAIAIVLAWGAYAWSEPLLKAAGGFFVDVDQLEPVEIIVVLAGDGTGHRIMKAVDLVRQGLAPKILVSGPQGHYGHYESDLAIEFAVKRGAAAEIFDGFPMDVHSTQEEARVVDAELRRRGINKAIVVTSNFHTRRARRIFKQQGGNTTEYLMASAPNPFFEPDNWWQSRAGKKIFVMESLKTLNSWVEQGGSW